jgi:hypothetical protein
MKLKSGAGVLFVVAGLMAISGCAKNGNQSDEIPGKNLVTSSSCTDGASVGPFKAICPASASSIQPADSVAAKKFLKSIAADSSKIFMTGMSQGVDSTLGVNSQRTAQAAPAPSPSPSASPSLVLGYPVDLLGQQNVFGGVITKTSDANNETFGGLKLTDLPPIHVKTLLAQNSDGSPAALALVGCTDACDETSQQQALIQIPIVGVDDQNGLIAVDLAALGSQLDLVSMLDPDGSFTGLKAVSSKTTAMDFSLSTLVFDVETDFVPKPQAAPAPGASPTPAPANPPTGPVSFTVRWYLKLDSGFNPAFESRSPVPQVGFFETERAKDTKITRFAYTDFGDEGVHYYIKNVPTEWQPAFSGSLDSWNTTLKPIIGRPLLTYEFVKPGDPMNDALVPGDIRYNIIEWDLDNKASYGGLGPSIANQFTGETFSAAIYIQGPTIMNLYTDWFHVQEQVNHLQAVGRQADADLATLDFSLRMAARQAKKQAQAKIGVLLGKLPFRVVSQMPAYDDPIDAQRNDFDPTPTGVDFQDYMNGYFHDMVTHEMGHNLGLRHNFRGSLASDDSNTQGHESRSVMEYLSRPYRYLDGVGVYDVMAITYGYTGKLPTVDNWYCTDEDKVTSDHPTLSAECSSDDATSDPFSFFEKRLSMCIDKVVNRGSADAPSWTIDNMGNELGIAMAGLLSYATSAEATSKGWTNFFGKPGRPADGSGVRAYVLASIKGQLCDTSLETAIGAKSTAQAQAATRANVQSLRDKFAATAKTWGAFTAAELSCQ